MLQATNCQNTYPKVLVLLGSNATSTLADSASIVRDALDSLSGRSLRITRIGNYYSTACFPAGAGPDFINVAAGLETDLSPNEVLARLHEVEAEFGRERPSRWAPRTLDIDLIAYGSEVAPNLPVLQHWMDLPLDEQKRVAPDELILPHPRMHERAFALIPLADISSDWRHPVVGKTIGEMVHDLPEEEKMGVLPYDMD